MFQLRLLTGLILCAGVIVSAATPTQLAISGPTAPVAGTCVAMQVIAEDSMGNPAPVTADTTASLVGKVVAALFTGMFADSGCTQATVSVLLPKGSTTGTFYFADQKTQQVTLIATPPPPLTAGTLVVNVAPAPPSKMALTGFPQMKTTTCSSAFVITVTDVFRNPSPVTQPVTVTLSGAGSGTIYRDTACTQPVTSVSVAKGSSSFPVYLKDPKGETITLNASTAAYGSATRAVVVTVPSGPPASSVGAGKISYNCPPGATTVSPPQNGIDNLTPAVASSSAGQTLCIQGEHRIPAPLTPKANQTWIGIGNNVRISGAVQLTQWQSYSPGVWTYTGPYRTQMHTLVDFAIGVPSCYTVSTYQDDLFYRTTGKTDDQRIMRVMSLAELTGALTTPGQAETGGENQRFFFDYGGTVTGSPAIYISFDPTNYVIDLPVIQTVIAGQGVTGVTIQNIFLEKALNTVISTGTSWTLQDTTVRFAHNTGLNSSAGTRTAPATLNRVRVFSNGQYGLTVGTWTTIENSDFSWGNIANYRKRVTVADSNCAGYYAAGGMKAVHAHGVSASAPGLTITSTISHHNIGAGGWDDVGSQYITVQNSHFYSNEGTGYMHEIGCDINFTGNEVDHNGNSLKNPGLGQAALLVLDSNNGTFSGNTFHDNRNPSINVFFQATHSQMQSNACLGAANDGDTSKSAMNNTVTGNSVYVCSTNGAVGYTDSDLSKASSRNNVFLSNTYHMGTSTGTFWANPFAETWSQWQADGEDLQGTLTVGCTYP
jgi:hypothetical protein